MKRTPLRRTGPLKRGKRLRPVSQKTRETRWPVLTTLRAYVLARAKGKCEFVAGTGHRGPLDCDHVVARSQKRADHPDNAVLLCRKHHDDKVRPFSKGRLVITPLGQERFRFEIITAADKWEARAQ